MQNVWTEKAMVELIEKMDPKQLHRPLNRLWERQTRDEQLSEMTTNLNGVGYSANDAPFAASLLSWWKKNGFFTDKQTAAIRKMLKRYRRQLTEIANETAVPVKVTEPVEEIDPEVENARQEMEYEKTVAPIVAEDKEEGAKQLNTLIDQIIAMTEKEKPYLTGVRG